VINEAHRVAAKEDIVADLVTVTSSRFVVFKALDRSVACKEKGYLLS
jgi:hypothetical protein